MNSASFSPDGRRIATASQDGTARLWDAASGEAFCVLSDHAAIVWSASFSSDGARVVTASADGTGRIWDPADGQEIHVLRGHERRVNRASFSSDGRRIVTTSDDQTARLWDAASGNEIARITLDAGIFALSISGGAIALGDALGRIHVFDADAYLTDKEPIRA